MTDFKKGKLKQSRMSKRKIFTGLLLAVCMLVGCVKREQEEPVAEMTSEVGSEAASEPVITEAESGSKTYDQTEEKTEDLTEVQTEEPTTEVYVHGDDGYYCTLDDYSMSLEAQTGGTCWVYAAACTMKMNWFKKTGEYVELSPYRLLDLIYADDDKKGITVKEGDDYVDLGGNQVFVTFKCSNGFDGYVLDDTTFLDGHDHEALKAYIRENGGVAACVPDARSYRRNFHGYFTINQVTDNYSFYDHDVTIVGWDDHFPKDYFLEPASQDGAWLAYNSMFANELYYISYDTLLLEVYGHSITDKYKEVLSHDEGMNYLEPSEAEYVALPTKSAFGNGVKVANVFSGKGKLGAVGTYSLTPEQDIKIEICDKNMEKVLYTQGAHFKNAGYHTVELTEPMDVDGFAVAVTYGFDAPAEGEGVEDWIRFIPNAEKGVSYLWLDGEWKDTTDPATARAAGLGVTINNVCIKALMLK